MRIWKGFQTLHPDQIFLLFLLFWGNFTPQGLSPLWRLSTPPIRIHESHIQTALVCEMKLNEKLTGHREKCFLLLVLRSLEKVTIKNGMDSNQYNHLNSSCMNEYSPCLCSWTSRAILARRTLPLLPLILRLARSEVLTSSMKQYFSLRSCLSDWLR